MRRVNWPFAAIVALAILAIVARAILTDYYAVPRIVRHHLADFGFAAVFTAVFSTLINLFTPRRLLKKHPGLFSVVHITVAFAGLLQGLNIEREDYFGEAKDGFDPGVFITNLLGTQNTDTFDWWDIVVIILGGLLVIYLQWRSTRSIKSWRRISLFTG